MMQINTVYKRHDNTCTTSLNLSEAQKTKPYIRDVIEYAEPRMLSTLLVSGVMTNADTVADKVKTKISLAPESSLIGGSAMHYDIMGRIQRSSDILGQVGSSYEGGSFQLRMKDTILYEGHVVTFYDGVVARVQNNGTPSTTSGGGYVYLFQTFTGETFNYTNSVTPMAHKKLFGGYTTYEEASRRGYSRQFHPERYVNHMTIQRAEKSLTGSALTDVVWTHFKEDKGWEFTSIRTLKHTFSLESEHQRWFGTSTWRNTDGTLRNNPVITSTTTGKFVSAGDGILRQVEDGNFNYGSGNDGYATIDDHIDMLTTIKKYSAGVYGSESRYACVTGADGYMKATQVLRDYWKNSLGGNHSVNGNSMGNVTVGGNFDTFTLNGMTVTFVEHPMFSDEARWSNVASDGNPLYGGMYLYLDLSKVNGGPSKGGNNLEILTKGAYGINRSMVMETYNGLTGHSGTAVSKVDALEVAMLKEDMINIYCPKACGVIYRTPV